MSAVVEIRAPSETEGTRSQLLRWLHGIGERVAQNEPLIELETDKVTIEVASPASGVLSEILKQEQEEVLPGELLGRIEPHAAAGAAEAEPGRISGPRAAPAPGSPAGAPPAARRAEPRAAVAAGAMSPPVRRP